MLTHDEIRKLHTHFQRLESMDKEIRFLLDVIEGKQKVEALGLKIRESIGRSAFNKLRDDDVGIYCVVALVNALLDEREAIANELDNCDVSPAPCPSQVHRHKVNV